MYLGKPSDACGIIGIFGAASCDAALLAHTGLYALQHRGHEACGIAVNLDREIEAHKGTGLLSEVFSNDILSSLKGQMAVGHVQNSLKKEATAENAQPIVSRYVKGNLTIAMNGAIVNAAEIKTRLELDGAIFQTDAEPEIIAYLIARERLKCKTVEDAVANILPELRGAYSLIVMSPQKMMAVRDPNGVKPLCMGRLDNMLIFASESCAIDAVGGTVLRDICPGEMVVAGQSDIRSVLISPSAARRGCIFEYIYFARPDTVLDGRSVYRWRFEAGKLLARKNPVDVDFVTGVPDSGLDAASGYSSESGLPFENAFVMNGYIKSGFSPPERSFRAIPTGQRYNVLGPFVKDKRVLFIDDSIVRGITSADIVRMLRSKGAREVHMRVLSPKFRFGCLYGADIPQVIERSAPRNPEEIRRRIGADSLAYLDIADIFTIMGERCFCDACYTGEYFH